jgi:hypothetical protein
MPDPTPPDDPPRAKGKAIRRSDEELDALAEVTPEDIEAARDLWDKDAPERYRGLIDAEEGDDDG